MWGADLAAKPAAATGRRFVVTAGLMRADIREAVAGWKDHVTPDGPFSVLAGPLAGLDGGRVSVGAVRRPGPAAGS